MDWVTSCRFLILVMILIFQGSAAERCNGATEQFIAHNMPNSLLSPHYPSHYESEDSCTYIIRRAVPDDGYMMQLTAVDFDLNDYNKDCKTDFLEIYEGNTASGTPVATWCGSKYFMLKTDSPVVTLYFKSDRFFTGKGFAIFYSQVKYASAECMEAPGDPIQVGNFPVYESFRGSMTKSRCEWQIESSDPDRQLVIELFKPSTLSCRDGVYNFFEGDTTSGHISFQYCSTSTPFSLMYLQSYKASITFEPSAGSGSGDDVDDMILKFTTRSNKYQCTPTDAATIEILEAPVIFSLPYMIDNNGASCPVILLTPEDSKALRLDVMGTNLEEATCESDLVDVYDSVSGEKIHKECGLGHPVPVHRQQTMEGLKVQSKTQSTTYLRAAAVPLMCNGLVNTKMAYRDLNIMEVIPSRDGYSNLAYCKYLISAPEDGDTISLTVMWNTTLEDQDLPSAPGDFINIYDGSSESDELLFTSHKKDSDTHKDDKGVHKTVVSTGGNILLVLEADAKIEGLPAHIKYHAIPGGSHCPEGKQHIHVSSNPQTITSPNYPNALPLHHVCHYHLMSDDQEKDIIVEVVDSNLPTHCQNLLYIAEGDIEDSDTYDIFGRVCGKDHPLFTLSQKDVTLVTQSGDIVGPGGWKVKVYTQARSEGGGGGGGGNSGQRITLSLWLFLLAVISGAKTVTWL